MPGLHLCKSASTPVALIKAEREPCSSQHVLHRQELQSAASDPPSTPSSVKRARLWLSPPLYLRLQYSKQDEQPNPYSSHRRLCVPRQISLIVLKLLLWIPRGVSVRLRFLRLPPGKDVCSCIYQDLGPACSGDCLKEGCKSGGGGNEPVLSFFLKRYLQLYVDPRWNCLCNDWNQDENSIEYGFMST